MVTDSWQNLLRKYSYLDYYRVKPDETAFFNAPTLRVHVGKLPRENPNISSHRPLMSVSHNTLDHCIEMLRQVLMCSADLHLIVYDWVEQVHYPWPDFGTDHMCRDYERVHDWVKSRVTKTERADGLLERPVNAVLKPVPQV